MKKGVTLKDLADKLNMSVSTVSKALSNDASISEMTKLRVKQLSDDWNYIPNEAARHFKLNKTFTLGLIIPDLLDQFYGLAINGVEDIAAQNKYNVIVAQSHENAQHEAKIVDVMMRNRVDGMIVAISKHTSDLTVFRKLTSFGIPVVFFSRSPQDHSFNYVSADNEEGAMKAMDFLFKRGHQRIAHFMGPTTLRVSQARFEGYKKALRQESITFAPELVKVTDLTFESTCRAVDELMNLDNPPTAIFTFKNYISLDIIRLLKTTCAQNLNQIDIVGFGNLPLIQHLDHKPAASIDENSFEMGSEAARLLFTMLGWEEVENSSLPKHIKVSCNLVVH